MTRDELFAPFNDAPGWEGAAKISPGRRDKARKRPRPLVGSCRFAPNRWSGNDENKLVSLRMPAARHASRPSRFSIHPVGEQATGACMGAHSLSLPGGSRLRLRRDRYSLVPQSSHSALHYAWRKYLPPSTTDWNAWLICS